MNSNRRLDNSSSQHYIESEITMHQASLEAWVEATLVRSGKLNDGPSPWETQNPVPDFPFVQIPVLIQEPRWYILSSLWSQLGLCGGSLNEVWVGFISFQCRPLVDSGIKVIKEEDQKEFLTIKEPGGITKCRHSRPCSLKIRWDGANSLPALVYNLFPFDKMTGLTITNIQSSESLEMIETRPGRWNTQGQAGWPSLSGHCCHCYST